MKKLLPLAATIFIFVACSTPRYYIETSVVDKADSARLHVKPIKLERLKPGMLNVGDTLRRIKLSNGPQFK